MHGGLFRNLRAWLGHGALLAFLLAALVPAGFMPVVSARTGGLTIILCTGNGAVAVSADALGTDGTSKAPVAPGHELPCIFAALGASLLAPPLLALPLVLPLPRAAEPAPLRQVRSGRGLPAPPPPATGPPVTLSH